jgi:Ser/Thr protein kinase RdoA (MazF antagonist)
MDTALREPVITAAGRYIEIDSSIQISKLGDGNINDTYLVKGTGRSFVLQRINGQVFPRPELVVENFLKVTEHIAARSRDICPQWQDIRLIATLTGKPFFKDAQGGVWRAQDYIGGTATFATIATPGQAGQVGLALGTFHRLLADLKADSLQDSLPGFHVLASYLEHFDRVSALQQGKISAELGYCLDSVEKYRDRAQALSQAEKQGRLIPRIIHGDPKAANVLFAGNRAICLIDLDTVRPGLLLYDIGDCLRSCCNPGGEKGNAAVRFDAALAREILVGYETGAGTLFTKEDKALVFEAVRLLTFELGLRFLTDFLDGNRYFKTKDSGENLRRASRQFRLLAALLATGDSFW